VKNELNDDLSMQRAERLPPDEAHHDPHHPAAVRQAAIRTALVGIAHSVLFILTVWMLKSRAPDLNASDAEIVSFYSNSNDRRLVLFAGLYLIPFAGIAFIWFIVALRMWETGSAIRENVLFSNVQLVCGVIYTALLFVGGASMSVVAASVELSGVPIDPLQARQFPQYGTSIILVFAMRMAAMFVLTTSNLGRSTGILPRWFIYVGFVVAVGLLLVASLSAWLVIVFPAWILVFSTILLNRARKIPRDLVFPDRIEAGPPAVPH
jgi:hypothetical protein